MTPQHTPGPWIIAKGPTYCAIRTYERVIVDMRLVDLQYNQADALLIAKAPEMLKALKDAYPYISDNALRERVGNLIADATGVQA